MCAASRESLDDDVPAGIPEYEKPCTIEGTLKDNDNNKCIEREPVIICVPTCDPP
jgi:hypothetical protein